MLKIWICFLALTACVTSQTTSESKIQLTIEKISKVMRHSDPSGRNHSIAIEIKPHEPLPDDVQWKLIIRTLGKETKWYTLTNESTNPTQTTFVFEGNFYCSDAIYLEARNNSGVVASSFETLKANEISPKPELDFQDGNLVVTLHRRSDYKTIEVVTYDPASRTAEFSQDGYNCYIAVTTLNGDPTPNNDEQKVTCTHNLTLPEGQTKMKVLVVTLDDKGVVYESSLQDYDTRENAELRDHEAGSNAGVIVGSIIGCLLGVSLIAYMVRFYLKEMDGFNITISDPPEDQDVKYTASTSGAENTAKV